MRRFLLRLVSLVKGRSIIIDDRIPISFFIFQLIEKFFMLLRGLVKCRKPVFIGKHVKLSHVRKFYSEDGVEIGDYSQIYCLSERGLHLGKGAKLGRFCIVSVSGTFSNIGEIIKLGSNVAIGDFAHIGGAGGVIIGSDTITGSFLSIHPENHNFNENNMVIRDQGVTRKGVIIGENCWIGAKVTFLDGSEIGSGCVVAAGAVVNKVFGDNLIIGGIPARVLGHR